MTYDYYSRVLCPFCGSGEMRAVNASLARCTECRETMSHQFFDTFLEIRSLTEAECEHARELGHCEMRDLPSGVHRCPSCGGEITSQAKRRRRRTVGGDRPLPGPEGASS